MRIVITPLIAVVAAVSILVSTPTNADLGDQLAKLLPNDGAAGDGFGVSVSVSGSIAIFGVWKDDDNGEDSGSAYLFDLTTNKQIVKLLADDGAAFDKFGHSVAISGSSGKEIAFVGAHKDDDNGSDSGSVYLFDVATGKQIAKLLPEDGAAGDTFGFSLAIKGSIVIIGAVLDDDNGTNSGSAYLFDVNTGAQLAKLLPDDGAEFDQFGISVAITEKVAIIGTWFDDDNGHSSGSAYLFDTTTGQQIAKLLPNDGAANDWFGTSVAINDSVAIIGAPQDDDNDSNSGSAYLFDLITGLQITKLLPEDGAKDDIFGLDVAISNTSAIVGAQGDDDNGDASGSAYLFDIASGKQIAKLLANDGAAVDLFGASIAINQEIAIVGAWSDEDNGIESGSAYLFDAIAIPGNCPWDLDGSGSVGINDLIELFAQWGTDDSADFDGDGLVSKSDLVVLLANWGPCE